MNIFNYIDFALLAASNGIVELIFVFSISFLFSILWLFLFLILFNVNLPVKSPYYIWSGFLITTIIFLILGLYLSGYLIWITATAVGKGEDLIVNKTNYLEYQQIKELDKDSNSFYVILTTFNIVKIPKDSNLENTIKQKVLQQNKDEEVEKRQEQLKQQIVEKYQK